MISSSSLAIVYAMLNQCFDFATGSSDILIVEAVKGSNDSITRKPFRMARWMASVWKLANWSSGMSAHEIFF